MAFRRSYGRRRSFGRRRSSTFGRRRFGGLSSRRKSVSRGTSFRNRGGVLR